MKRAWLPIAAIAVVAGCTAPVPSSAPERGVGFGDYRQYLAEQDRIRRERDAQLHTQRISKERPEATGAPTPAQAQRQPVVDSTFDPTLGADATPVITEEPIAPPLGDGATGPISVASAAPAAVTEPAPVVDPSAITSITPATTPTFSDPVVALAPGAEAIESQPVRTDPVRTTTARADTSTTETKFRPIQSTPLPKRPGSGPNIVDFALSVQHDPGTVVYPRAVRSTARADRNCARYTSPDLAQLDFLSLGGPTRDRKGLDPDGDGYACGWDPRPFRLARQS